MEKTTLRYLTIALLQSSDTENEHITSRAIGIRLTASFLQTITQQRATPLQQYKELPIWNLTHCRSSFPKGRLNKDHFRHKNTKRITTSAPHTTTSVKMHPSGGNKMVSHVNLELQSRRALQRVICG